MAGATAALEAADAGLRTVVITKDARAEESNTYYAQGGIVSFAPDDRPELLKEDILEAGDSAGDPAAVDILVGDGPAARPGNAHRQAQDPVHPELARTPSTTPSRPGTRAGASSTSRTPPAGPSRTASCGP
ncbi:MAG: FAD-binding protein [Candidatus Moduliflexus flocculans]|nr:FAD-binding protein [Candidatus Moduliflexus flocculans]